MWANPINHVKSICSGGMRRQTLASPRGYVWGEPAGSSRSQPMYQVLVGGLTDVGYFMFRDNDPDISHWFTCFFVGWLTSNQAGLFVSVLLGRVDLDDWDPHELYFFRPYIRTYLPEFHRIPSWPAMPAARSARNVLDHLHESQHGVLLHCVPRGHLHHVQILPGAAVREPRLTRRVGRVTETLHHGGWSGWSGWSGWNHIVFIFGTINHGVCSNSFFFSNRGRDSSTFDPRPAISQDQWLLLGLRGLCLHHVVLDDGFVSAPPAAAADHRNDGEGRGWTTNLALGLYQTSSWRLYTMFAGSCSGYFCCGFGEAIVIWIFFWQWRWILWT